MRGIFGIAVGVVMLTATASAAGGQTDQQLTRLLTTMEKNGLPWLVDGLVWMAEREAVHMLAGIAAGPRGAQGGQGGQAARAPSWYRPSQSRFSWEWLAARMDADGDGAIDADEFRGAAPWFAVLDRDRDGKITAADLDWSADSKLSRASQQAKAMFSAIDTDKNGQVSIEEWQAYMTKLAKDRKYLSQDDLLPLFLSSGVRKFAGKRGGSSNDARMNAFFCGDVGSWFEGPTLNGPAPNFSLRSPDGKTAISLSDSYGTTPVVLVFGSFT